MIRLVSACSTLSILAFLSVYFLSGSPVLVHMLFGLTSGLIMILLIWVYLLVSRFERVEYASNYQYCMRVHIIIHLVPLGYLVLQFFIRLSFSVNLLFLAAIMLFFLTGRRTWNVLYERFGSRMYQFFYKGNTGMLVGILVLLGVGVLYGKALAIEFLHRTLFGYFAIHFLLFGVAVMKIEKDVSIENSGDSR